MSLLFSSVVTSKTSHRAPNSRTLVLQAKSKLITSLAQLGKQAVLYGSAALNLYMPSHHRLPVSDLDFYIVVSDPKCFSDIVQQTCTTVNQQLRSLYNDASISVSWYLLSHGPDEITMSVSVNGIKFADLTRQFVHKLAVLERLFPRPFTKVVLPGSSNTLDMCIISLQEAAHRIACTVSCLQCLDGSTVIPFHSNADRIAKDACRLSKLSDLSHLGLLSFEPAVFILDAKDVPPGIIAEDVCVQSGVAMPCFMKSHSPSVSQSSLTVCRAVSSCAIGSSSAVFHPVIQLTIAIGVASCSVKTNDDVVFKRKRACLVQIWRQKSRVLHSELSSLKDFFQYQSQLLTKQLHLTFADIQRAVKRHERKWTQKAAKACHQERTVSTLYASLLETSEEQKQTLRLCRGMLKDGLKELMASTSAAVTLKELFTSLRAECRVVVTKLSMVLKVIMDGAPDDFEVTVINDSYQELLRLYVNKRVPGFLVNPTTVTSTVSCSVDHDESSDRIDKDTFITLHTLLVRSMLRANDILIGKMDDLDTFTYASKCTDGVQFTQDAKVLEPPDSFERRAELLNKHAESALVFMLMPVFRRLSYIHRLARAAVADCAENSSLLVLLRMTKPGSSDWSCLEDARKTAVKLQRFCKTLDQYA